MADLFEEQYSPLFSSRRAVLKDFMNSITGVPGGHPGERWQCGRRCAPQHGFRPASADASMLGATAFKVGVKDQKVAELAGSRMLRQAPSRKNAGVAGKPALGQQTDAALRRGVRSCYAQIAQEANASASNAARSAGADASRPTVLGEPRKTLVKKIRRMQDLETVTKGTKRYRELTETKAREKERTRATHGVWAGWAHDRPVMRLGGAATVRAASSCAAAHGAQARRWLGRTRARPGPAAVRRQVPRRPAAPHEKARWSEQD